MDPNKLVEPGSMRGDGGGPQLFGPRCFLAELKVLEVGRSGGRGPASRVSSARPAAA